MKKAIIMIALVTLSISNSIAQDSTTDNREKLTFGLKVGANYSNVYDSEGEDFVADGKFGLAGGVFVSIDLLNPFFKAVSLFNPLFYLINGFRYAVLGYSDVELGRSLLMTAAAVVVTYLIAQLALKKGSYSRW